MPKIILVQTHEQIQNLSNIQTALPTHKQTRTTTSSNEDTQQAEEKKRKQDDIKEKQEEKNANKINCK